MIGAGGNVRVLPLGERPPTTGVDGVLLRPRADQTLAEALDAAETLLADGLAPVPPGRSLRTALGLPVPVRPANARAAFPAPEPQPSL